MPPSPNKLVDHFFRHESGKLIAALTRFFGLRHLELVEDMVQAALLEALRAWQTQGVPNNPTAWIHRVAKNRVLDTLRRDQTFRRLAENTRGVSQESWEPALDRVFDESGLSDDLLRMIFACCHPVLAPESSIPLTLKTICGFSEQEIATSMLLQPENVRKRIYRAKQTMVANRVSLDLPGEEQLLKRLQVVHNVLYLMFNEGYVSSCSDEAIRLDVCEEAARLCHLLTEHARYCSPTTKALLALMLFHAARFQSRIDQEGGLVLLEDQDRAQWDRRLISRAMDYLNESSQGEHLSSYHFEAAIAMYHCQAPRFQDTNWSAIVSLYDRLVEGHASPIYELNRAVAIGQRDGPQQAIALLHRLEAEPQLKQFHLLDAALGEHYRMSGDLSQAQAYFQAALKKTQSPHDQMILRNRLAKCE